MRSGGFSGLGIAILEGRGWGEVGRVEFLIKVSFVMGESDCGGSTRVGRLGHSVELFGSEEGGERREEEQRRTNVGGKANLRFYLG